MLNRIIDLVKFRVERFLLGGAQNRLVFIAILLLLVSLAGGFFVHLIDPQLSIFEDAVWWAFLRLSDPGYLGDDQGALKRTVATVITILGYVLFMGALVAIMTQWLHASIAKLESGLTPISKNGHILILGWTNRTPAIVREILTSGTRLKRFLKYLERGGLHIVILAPEVGPQLTVELKEELGEYWNPRKITLRSGIPIRPEDLKRVDCLHASVIILPGKPLYEKTIDSIDAGTVKALLSISSLAEQNGLETYPPVVTEIMDNRRAAVTEQAYAGDVEVVSSNSIISRLICQIVRHPGLSYVYSELLTHEHGNALYIRECTETVGMKWKQASRAFGSAIPLGVLRSSAKEKSIQFCPDLEYEIRPEDLFVFVAPGAKESKIVPDIQPDEIQTKNIFPSKKTVRKKKLLFLGWSQKVPFLIEELSRYSEELYEIEIMSVVPSKERVEALSRHSKKHSNIAIKHIELDYTLPSGIAKCRPQNFDFVLFLASDWIQSGEETDARSILGYLLLHEEMKLHKTKPETLIELVDPDNEDLFSEREGEVIISPRIVSHLVGGISLRSELNLVFNELFQSAGAEFDFQKVSDYGLSGKQTFKNIQNLVTTTGMIAIGIRINSKPQHPIHLNPNRDLLFDLEPTDDILVLRR